MNGNLKKLKEKSSRLVRQHAKEVDEFEHEDEQEFMDVKDYQSRGHGREKIYGLEIHFEYMIQHIREIKMEMKDAKAERDELASIIYDQQIMQEVSVDKDEKMEFWTKIIGAIISALGIGGGSLIAHKKVVKPIMEKRKNANV